MGGEKSVFVKRKKTASMGEIVFHIFKREQKWGGRKRTANTVLKMDTSMSTFLKHCFQMSYIFSRKKTGKMTSSYVNVLHWILDPIC